MAEQPTEGFTPKQQVRRTERAQRARMERNPDTLVSIDLDEEGKDHVTTTTKSGRAAIVQRWEFDPDGLDRILFLRYIERTPDPAERIDLKKEDNKWIERTRTVDGHLLKEWLEEWAKGRGKQNPFNNQPPAMG